MWKGKMAAGAKKLGLPFGKKTSDNTASLQTTTVTVPESSYMYEKPEGSTLMSLEEESSPTEAMKYTSWVQHQEQLKESGYDQMPGAMWEAAAAAQIVQTLGVPSQQMGTASGPGESPSWLEVARQQKATDYPGTQQMEPDESMGSTLHDTIRRQSLAQIDTFQTLQSNLTPESSLTREIITIADLRSLADTATAQISPVESTSTIGGTLDTITKEENPIPLTLPRLSGAQTPYYNDDDPWDDHFHTKSPQPECRVFFVDDGPEDDTIIWWFTGAHSLAGTTDVPNPVKEELNQANHNDWPHCWELQWWVYDREDFDLIFEEYRRYFAYVWNWNQIWIDGNPYLLWYEPIFHPTDHTDRLDPWVRARIQIDRLTHAGEYANEPPFNEEGDKFVQESSTRPYC
ncbi:uncharacterized protein EV420DRAFT_1479954 [Desarmillaria tabescens]|uniref:Uncharacterized protein n=1 Tax=Armillaria tabescens TaxID=1929756 RepID=A0AA39KBP8_ARMTA|nr:uncharacterized protein EV420DRAFT_1479954 [Desarmillaria tabescens]KAK0458211.1 hypothetical protein EV420DRAFT_1479954 [Desarmillaria tabescens]